MEFDIEKKHTQKTTLPNKTLEVEYAISNWTKLHYII